MPNKQTIGTLRIFVASPGDVGKERDALAGVVNELNRTISALMPDVDARLELVRWETHTHPSMGRPQGVINEQIGDYDVFVGILWKRFGTPTGRAESGTEEEFRLAYDNWQTHQRPQILFYFSQTPSAPARSPEEVQQFLKVVQLRQELESKGLVWEYLAPERFADAVRPHLTEVVGSLLRAARSKTAVPASVSSTIPSPQHTTSGSRIRITELSPRDAYYKARDDMVGRTGEIIEIRWVKGWAQGQIMLDSPRFEGDNRLCTFAQMKYEVLE